MTGYLGPRRTLLVVDDQPTQRQMLAGMLLPLGFVVREAASGPECLERVRDETVDAVLLDIGMAGMDGWETARRLRAAGHHGVPIVVVSANAFENVPERLRESGCQAFVDKPVIESELLGALERHLHLEWVVEPSSRERLQRPDLRAAPAGSTLPPETLRRLHYLLRLGHRQGMVQLLDALRDQHPEADAEITALRDGVERWDVAEVDARLQRALAADEEERL